MSALPFCVGQRASLELMVTDEVVRGFAEVVRDFNPVHMDDEAAGKTRFGRRIAHGMLPASLISAVLGTSLPGPGTIYLEQHLKFVAPVFIGDQITAEVEIASVDPERGIIVLETRCTTGSGKLVVTGEAKVLHESISWS